MTSQLELSSRAALCRQLAMREPKSRALWMAEAESWSRLERAPGAMIVKRRDQAMGFGQDPFEEFLVLMEIENAR